MAATFLVETPRTYISATASFSARSLLIQGLRIINFVRREHFGQVDLIPATTQPLGLEARLRGLLLFQQPDGQLPQQRQVLATVAGMMPALVFAEHHIQNP